MEINNIKKHGLFVGDNMDIETCPICGEYIEAEDGEENGYGELHLYWVCDSCGSEGYANIDEHKDNEFIGHYVY